MRTGLLMVSVPVPLTHMAEFVCNLVKFNRCDPYGWFWGQIVLFGLIPFSHWN